MAKYADPVAVIGLGRFGSALALELVRRGTEVLAVDSDMARVQRLSGQLSQVVAADATDVDAMRGLGLADFSRAVVAIGTAQQGSILAVATLSELNVEHIWAKALDPQHARILTKVGAHHVVLPEHEMGERIAHLISGQMLDWIELSGGWVMARTRPPKFLVDVPLGRSGLRQKHHVTVVGVQPEHESTLTHAANDTVLAYGDEIIVAGHPDDVEKFVELI